ncbi:metal ABC transporter solute-binding protein, Zn/Mn family [Vibrio artabrorum]|uniref:Zinc ABC transporter substrate-binding protein n=1 Tax=Vibrio artabrorum TaxID=446374 RepID=A0ABT8CG74_9VIBR|nr:zinc ABC transporter substrate-binding protein [Vibrio artabrorum]MDN3700130.1 zinc ABC transporter substrate-binding protein [Vibrio artabrorum]
MMKVTKALKYPSVVLALVCSTSVMAKTVNTVTSFSVLGDIVQEVGGEHVQVLSLIGPDSDPHVFSPTPKDSVTLNKADVVFISGLGLEGWIERLVKASGYKGQVITASNGIQTRSMIDDGKTIVDPHAWNSMANGIIYATNIMNALIAADPQDATYFKEHGQNYIAKLTKLDNWAKDTFNAIPKEKRRVLTSHDAFGYFGAEYGVEFLAPQGYSTESEASTQKVASLINQIKAKSVNTYFMEDQTDPRLVKQIGAATNAKEGGSLFPEALSTTDVANTYAKAFKHNVTIITDSMK